MRLLIIRGDLQSHSGYSSAAREYCGLLAGFFDRLAGVDIHQSSARPFEPFPYPLVSEAEARHLTRGADFALVLSFTTPDRYRRYDNAVNVGLTFWETDRLPLSCAERPSWAGLAGQMDALWVPSSHTRAMFEMAGVVVPIREIPWPISTPPIVAARISTASDSISIAGRVSRTRCSGWPAFAKSDLVGRAGWPDMPDRLPQDPFLPSCK